MISNYLFFVGVPLAVAITTLYLPGGRGDGAYRSQVVTHFSQTSNGQVHEMVKVIKLAASVTRRR